MRGTRNLQSTRALANIPKTLADHLMHNHLQFNTIPLSLYVHLPWCVRKCPYCDFNSHQLRHGMQEDAYVDALLNDLQQDLPYVQDRPITTIFIGGGTPSLFSGAAINRLLTGIRQRVTLSDQAEITLEANPGTVEQQRFADYRQAGVNRLSLGIQSFNAAQLKNLGRIHDHNEALQAIGVAKAVGFRFNLDLMFALPHQTPDQALADLTTAIACQPNHISWYQLTLEPNTAFYHRPPPLPDNDAAWHIQCAGQALLAEHGYTHYEISAYSRAQQACQHNLNYWQFGDYLAIGAGAHGKITDAASGTIRRYSKLKYPNAYLQASHYVAEQHQLEPAQLPFEFMLNALRLQRAIPFTWFEQRCGLSRQVLMPTFQQAGDSGLLEWDENSFMPTPRGRQFLNDLLELFL